MRDAMLLWLGADALALIAGLASGGTSADVSAMTFLLAAPGLATLFLAGRAHRAPALAAFAAVWIVAAAVCLAADGGAGSPLIVLLALAPACIARFWRGWALVWSAVAALAAVVAGDALALIAPEAQLGLMPLCAALGALPVLAHLLARAPSPPASALASEPDTLAVAAHELRTPLTHVIGFADMMNAQVFGPLAPKYAEYAAAIRESGTNMLETLNAILDVSRIAAGKLTLQKTSMDLVQEARAVMDEARGGASAKNIELALEVDDGRLAVFADKIAVRRILTNLIGNAIKFTPENGRVSMKLATDVGGLEVAVADTGPGIPEAARAQVRAAFAQTDLGKAAGGAGLGLALVHALAAAHGGAMTIGDAPGGGALIRVRLPR